MERNLLNKLLKWKEMPNRKPLIIRGARQTGKTWLMREFGKKAFKKMVYVNFENEPRFRDLFIKDYNTARIISMLELHLNEKIDAEDTLLIFDEIQAVDGGLTSLKYFCEEAPQYAIVAAGSLLGISLHANQSFPVGKVDFLDLYPMSLEEFMCAAGKKMLWDAMVVQEWDMVATFHDELLQMLRIYMYVGGMPEAVKKFHETHDVNQMLRVQRSIIDEYKSDMMKYAAQTDKSKIRECFESIPKQLARDYKKFTYSVIRPNAKGRDYAGSLQWIEDAGIIHRCYNTEITELPLEGVAIKDQFKVYMADTGLLISMLEEGTAWSIMQGDLGAYKGAIYENLMADILGKMGRKLYYFHKDSGLEIDFLMRYKNECVLVECKARTGNAKSIGTILKHQEKYHVNHAIKCGDYNIGRQGALLTIPFYMAFLLKEL